MPRTLRKSGGAFFALAIIALSPAAALGQGESNSEIPKSPSVIERRSSELRQLFLARSLMQAKQWDTAIDAFTKVATASNDDVAAAGRAGLLHALAMRRKSNDDDVAQAATRKFRLGQAFLETGDWDKAIGALTEVAESQNASLAGDALQGIEVAIRRKAAGPLGIRAHLNAPFNRWRLIDYFVYAGAIGMMFMISLFAWVQWFGPFTGWILAACVKRSFDWKVTIAGSAQPEQRNAAFDEFVITIRDLRRSQEQSGISPPSIGQLRFFQPLSLGDIVGPNLKVQGLDVSRIAAMLQAMRDYYTYHFEIRVETIDGKPYVNASLRWAGHTEKVWQLPSLTEEASLDYRDIGQRLAFTVYGDSLVRT
ncbi:soluble NSF attachment family protein (plasmid) [Rhizobium sophoriradicis]|uniref:tetratricopeptide repeat protein n=1 Tax=Rhizobium sophoriradicis TaxID=1535245 RepID=UPI001609610F|nr:soluble NSF attachment family protein [Rhizobium leguminosarum bv. phaseoli]